MASESSAANRQEFRLCYVEDSWAWFTTQAVEDQWGDDWNDAPYEHNAGDPYDWRPYMAERGVEPYELLRVAWSGTQLEPPYSGHLNSPWSVEQINRGETAWLTDPMYGQRPRTPEHVVFAGATVDEFIAAIEARGGTVYLPKGAQVAIA